MPSRDFHFKSTFLNHMALVIHGTLPPLCVEWHFPKGAAGYLQAHTLCNIFYLNCLDFLLSFRSPCLRTRSQPFPLNVDLFGSLICPLTFSSSPSLLLRPISRPAFSVHVPLPITPTPEPAILVKQGHESSLSVDLGAVPFYLEDTGSPAPLHRSFPCFLLLPQVEDNVCLSQMPFFFFMCLLLFPVKPLFTPVTWMKFTNLPSSPLASTFPYTPSLSNPRT